MGNRTFSDGSKVEKYLREDTVKSVKPWLTEIMNNYKVRELFLLLSILGTFQMTQSRDDFFHLGFDLPFFTFTVSYKYK